jgi:hypothetical protein
MRGRYMPPKQFADGATQRATARAGNIQRTKGSSTELPKALPNGKAGELLLNQHTNLSVWLVNL